MADSSVPGLSDYPAASIQGASDRLVIYDNSGGQLCDVPLDSAPIRGISGTVVNIQHHGAVADGATNAVSSINDAVAEMSDGDTLYMPPGTYLIDGTAPVIDSLNRITVIMDNVTFQNHQANAAQVGLIYRGCTHVKHFGGSFDLGRSRNTDSPPTSYNMTGISVQGCTDMKFDSVHAQDVQYCIDIDENTSVSPNVDSARITITNPSSESNQYPYAGTEDPLAPETYVIAKSCDTLTLRDGTIYRMRAIFTTNTASSGLNSRNVKVVDITCKDAVDTNFYFQNTDSITCHGLHAINTGKDGIKAVEGCDDVIFSHCFVRNTGHVNASSSVGLMFNNMSNGVMIGCNAVWDNQSASEKMIPYGIYASTDVTMIGCNFYNRIPAANADVNGITVSTNTASGDGNVERLQIIGGNIFDATNSGIYFDVTSTYTISDVLVDGVAVNSDGNHYTNEAIDMRAQAGGTISRFNVRKLVGRGMADHLIQFGGPGTTENITIEDCESYDFQNSGDETFEIDQTYTVSPSGSMSNVRCINNRHYGTGNLTGFFQVLGTGDDRYVTAYGNLIDGVETFPLVNAVTSDETQTATDNDKIFSNEGATGLVTITLENWTVGKKRKFICHGGSGVSPETRLRIAPASGENFVGLAANTGQEMVSDGGSLVVWCDKDGTIAYEGTGTFNTF